MRNQRHLMVAALALAAATGCGGGDSAGDDAPATAADGAIEVEAGDLYFDPESLETDAGDIEIALDNVGAIEHDFVVEEADDTVVVTADPGETATGSISLESGAYTFYCSIPGHRQAGMEGTLEVN